jgi:UBX domain-containing protein 1
MSGDENDASSTGRTLGGAPTEPLPANWAQRSSASRVGRIGDWNRSSSGYIYICLRRNFLAEMFYRGERRGVGRIESRGGLGSGGGRQSHDNNDDDNEEEGEGEGEGESWFAGGERRQVFFISFPYHYFGF